MTPIELIPFFILAIAGNLAHILTKFATMESEGTKFNALDYLISHKYSILLGVIVSILGVYIYDSMGELSHMSAILSGFCCDSVMKTLQDRMKPTKPTPSE